MVPERETNLGDFFKRPGRRVVLFLGGGYAWVPGLGTDCTRAVRPGLEQGDTGGLPQAPGQLAGLLH